MSELIHLPAIVLSMVFTYYTTLAIWINRNSLPDVPNSAKIISGVIAGSFTIIPTIAFNILMDQQLVAKNYWIFSAMFVFSLFLSLMSMSKPAMKAYK